MRAKTHSDFIYAFLLALLLHGAVGYCAGSVLLSNRSMFQPVFKAGLSSVALTLVPPAPSKANKKHEKPDDEFVQQPPLIQVNPEEPDKVTEDDINADEFEKGVVNAVVSESQIRPRYPYGSRIRGEEGVVVLTAVLDAAGHPKDVVVFSSSGYQSLDRAAVKAMTEAVFKSDNRASLAGEEVEYTFRFQLKDL